MLSTTTCVDPDTIHWMETNPDTRWSDLDRLLVQFWDSRLIRPKVVYFDPRLKNGKRVGRDWAVCMLPEMAKKGIVDLVGECDEYQASTVVPIYSCAITTAIGL